MDPEEDEGLGVVSSAARFLSDMSIGIWSVKYGVWSVECGV